MADGRSEGTNLDGGPRDFGTTLFLGLVLLLAMGIGLWFVVQRGAQPPAPPAAGQQQAGPPLPRRRSGEEARALLEKKNRALGLLDNEKLADAERLWSELAKELPGDPLPARNLAVCRLLAAKGGLVTIASADSAVEEMLKREPETALAWQLAGRVATLAAEKESDPAAREGWTTKALERFSKGAELDAALTANWYDLYSAARYSRDAAVVARGRMALYRARESAPANLFLLADSLQALAEEKSDKLAGALEEARGLLQPVARGIQARARVDVNKFLDEALAAVRAGKWPEASAKARVLATVTRPEEYAQGDRKLIDPYPLEFVLTTFATTTLIEPLPPEEIVVPNKVTLEGFDMQGVPEAFATALDHAVADVDLDGVADLVLLGPGKLTVLSLKLREGGVDSSIARERFSLEPILTAEVPAGLERVIVVDLDRDKSGAATGNTGTSPTAQPGEPVVAKAPAGCFEADPDFVLTGPAGVVIALNVVGEAGRTVNVVTQEAGLQAVKGITVARAVDIDQEGDLDLVLATAEGLSLWSNRGDLQFEDLTARSTFQLPVKGIEDLMAVDFDRDIDIDLLYVSPSTKTIGLLENLRHGEFRTSRPCDSGWGEFVATRGVALELDGTPSWDLALLGGAGLLQTVTRTPDRGRVVAHQYMTFPLSGFTGLHPGDWNNDGHTDLALWSEEGLFLSLSAGVMTAPPVDPLIPPDWQGNVLGLVSADLDGDGDLDLLPRTDTGVTLVRNVGGEKLRGLSVRVFGENDAQSGRVNQYNVGGLLELRANGSYQARVITGQTTHFGLGTATKADVLRVLFTNGVPQAVLDAGGGDLSAGTGATLCEKQILKGSCPYLYTWTGTEFAFFTDLLWNAPLGLQIREGTVLPDRPWEYLRIDPDRLLPRDGNYELRVTSELWEADYFDRIELLAVDHPGDIEVYSNEKVGPPDIAEFRLHTVRNARRPVAARDSRGRDVLQDILVRDGKYARCFNTTYLQGIAEPHHLELDLGPASSGSGAVKLFLTGWMYPTDTSLNVGLTNNPTLAGPQPPSLWVVGANGSWTESKPFMGFPGGKPKTIVVDLTGVFPTTDRRLRIATTQELFWDEVFFTEGEAPAETRVRPLPLRSADLRYRGFSAVAPRGLSTPERIDYSSVSTSPKWPPMGGRFTRYGDVASLLTDRDDQLVVMSPGDEIALSFEAGDPPPPGWTRTFILHSVGWDKDADLHTLYGQTAEPLPYTGMTSYPYGPEDQPPDTEPYREYIQRYQTRTMPWREFGGLPTR